MPMINIEDAYILGETGAQVDKVTGLFTKDEDTTSGEKAFAQLNIGTAGSNRNLLDNPWFTVNQRSWTSTAAGTSGYTVDRWKKGTNGTATKITNGIRIAPSSEIFLTQVLPSDLVSWLVGKTVTLSVYAENVSGTMRLGGLGSTNRATIQNGYTSVTFTITSASNAEINLSSIVAGSTADIYAVKLELGSVSTLANDAPPDYESELLKCQYYFVRLNLRSYRCSANGVAINTTTVYFDITLPTNMRPVIPTVAITGTLYALRNGSTSALTGVSPLNDPRGTYLSLQGTCTNLTALTNVPIYTANNNVVLDISADL